VYVEKERKQLGFNTWAEATRQVQDRSQWRGLVHGQLLEFNAFFVASLKMCFSPRFYTFLLIFAYFVILLHKQSRVCHFPINTVNLKYVNLRPYIFKEKNRE
jgi:hypothetical protein